MRETEVETHLHKQVTLRGGTTRKFTGRSNNTDRIVIWPDYFWSDYEARVHFVETKAPKKGPSAGQKREHTRLRNLGCRVFVINTIEKVDRYVKNFVVQEC